MSFISASTKKRQIQDTILSYTMLSASCASQTSGPFNRTDLMVRLKICSLSFIPRPRINFLLLKLDG